MLFANLLEAMRVAFSMKISKFLGLDAEGRIQT